MASSVVLGPLPAANALPRVLATEVDDTNIRS